MLGSQKAQIGALVATVLAVLTAVGTALPDGTTAKVAVGAAGTALTAAATYLGVYNTPNKPRPPVRSKA